MKLKTTVAIALSAMIAASLVGAPGVASAAKKKKKAPKGPIVMSTDEAGDWGNDNPSGQDISAFGNELGMDLIEASIEMADKETVNFVITVDSLPATGGLPEIPRYIWSLDVDGEYVELDGKFTNYSRGACDPTAGTCPMPRDPGQQPFAVRGDCTTDATANLTTCQELGIVQAAFDSAEGTITIPVPLELMGAKKGSKIKNGSSSFTAQSGGAIIAIPSAFVSRSDMPRDAMIDSGKTFVVPKK